MGGSAKAYIAGVRWRLGMEAKEFVNEIYCEGKPFDWGVGEEVEWAGVMY